MEKLLLIDGHSILSRAFYGVPYLSTGDGRPTNAVYGFMNILLKVMQDVSPDYIAVSFDLDRKELFRTGMYPAYKGNRKPMPAELLCQVPVMQDLLKAMKVPVYTCKGYEADDVLGTLAGRGASEGMDVTVLTGDRDLLQLAGENVRLMIPKTSKGQTEVFVYRPEDVKREYRVTPEEFIDLKALMGDSSDNIPGLPGIGEKTAADIISTYHSIENAREHADELRPPRAQAAFREHYDLAVLSKDLATIRLDAPVEADLRAGRTSAIYTREALAILRDLELKTLAARFAGYQEEEPEPERTELPGIKAVADPFLASVVFDDCLNAGRFGFSWALSEDSGEPVQLSLFEEQTADCREMTAAFYLPGRKLCVIRSGEKYAYAKLKKDISSLFRRCAAGNTEIDVFGKKEAIKEFPELETARVFDTALAAYLINPIRGEYTYDTVAKDMLGLTLRSTKEILMKDGSGSDEVCAYRAWCACSAASVCEEKLKQLGMHGLYEDVELPLCNVLADMEKTGIRADGSALDAFSGKLKAEIRETEESIYQLAGENFNVNSPVQLGTVLFEKLGLPGGKKTKKGYSTAADVLEKLADGHEIVRKVLRFRTLSKLNSTYAEGLRGYIAEDGRIHGTFHQTVTATGRLSSTDPNLQNIPVRTGEGRELRKVFIPADGCVFVDADYSQVELRILASLSGDENLISAYRNSVDIHTATAASVFHVPPEEVTPEMRRNAKAVNFGIVYGISAFGLGEDLSISRKDALGYINTYFETYPQVKAYLDGQIKKAKETGSVATYYGRVRPVPELKSSNFMERSFGERIAMNSPIQGTAADIIKIAMNRVYRRLRGMGSRIVLQIHDELLVEAPVCEKEEVARILREEMEAAASLPVPLSVEVKTGENWNECH